MMVVFAAWLKAQDVPVPASPREIYLGEIGDVLVTWSETADIETSK